MLPEGWKLSCLGDACSGELQTGPFGSQLHAHEYIEHGVSVLMPKDLIKCRANIKTAAKISVEKSKELKRHRLKFGDILFSRRGDVARLALIDGMSEGSLCGTGCLRARPSTKAFPDFLFFFLQLPTIKSWLEHNAVGQTMPNMNTEILYELPLILPPLPEQKKIAAILSTWDCAIEETEKLLANSQQQKKALMQQLLTGKKRLPGFMGEWKVNRLGEISSSFTGLTGKTKNDFGSGYKYITYKNIFLNSRTNIDDIDYVKIKKNESQNKLQYGDILLTTSSETPEEVGMSSVFLYEGEDIFYLNSFCFGFRPKSLLILYPDFSQFLFRGEEIRRKIQLLAQGATRYNISKNKLSEIFFKLPPLPEQKAIAAVLTTADEEIAAFKSDLSRLRDEKKALMQQLLTGKRRVKVDQEISDTGL